MLGLLERNPSLRARWFRSLFSIFDVDDLAHLDLAWWTFDAMDKVETWLADRPDARVFEWGSGASTLWLSKRVAHVTSVEHDTEWVTVIEKRTAALENVDLSLVPPDESGQIRSGRDGFRDVFFDSYVHAIERTDSRFDLIIIDGRARAACLDVAVNHLSDGGIILFDNSCRERYRAAIDGSGLVEDRLKGLTPSLPYADCTSLLTVPH
ncbi:class I SAM-dependent methyltransferase [Oceanomicrobium pacificus]|uniref:Class I SAM-dependent methyltransferase n=1 Tax=Oceanomicrobium pacificus TaxID=2692916 RepID=A0A6B0TVW4_9RHOB|nr:class I SAM-dependent methyltransferase [Oceanomicrobium pacificus]MXU65133.1 class I SAM-dependent methyltransferase [Oceanomicrobium pacificus]